MRKRPTRAIPQPLATPTYAGVDLDRAFAFEICATGIAIESPGSVCSCRRPALGSWGRGLTEEQLLEESPLPCGRCKLIPPIPWSRIPNHAATTAGAALVKATGLVFRLQEREVGNEHEVRFIADPVPDPENLADQGVDFDLVVGKGARRLAGRCYVKLRAGIAARAEDRGAAVARASVAALRTVRAWSKPAKPGNREDAERRERDRKAKSPEAGPPEAGQSKPTDPPAPPEVGA